ncbi:MAG TPA: GTPase Era [Alphaproteobacteria bacterium]|jgi:GTP-binding protein Era|nr:GTPase Era [Alphaproteobacteria bacterium]MDP7428077.1 GTPase Era [Alphaproteobacteria bacterium]HJM51071.1 GTPase Era [Alphaproteobacteria bacterium]
MIEGGASSQKRCGFVALLGAPNAGKSTLLNALVGSKLAIVTPKVQTTRARLVGIALEAASQLVFVDTPGIFAAKRRLERAMVAAAWSGASDADLCVLLVDAQRPPAARGDDTEHIIEGLEREGRRAVLALNKIDLVERRALLPRVERLMESGVFSDTFMISALAGDGVDDLRRHLADAVPLGPWLYPEDQLADVPLRFLAAEVTREQLFLQLHQELPYALTVEVEGWHEQKDGSVRIEQVIYVTRQNHKGIVLGRGGSRIKAVGEAARRQLEEAYERRVHLFLFVKVRENWLDDPERYQAMGLEFPE